MNRNFCNRCGSRISGDMTYCSMCGEQIPEEDISFVQPMPNYAGRDYGSYAYNNYYAAQAAMYMNYQQLVMNEYRKARLDNKGRVALLMIFLGFDVLPLIGLLVGVHLASEVLREDPYNSYARAAMTVGKVFAVKPERLRRKR